jgi:protein-S-isoprenylcysteine O-methyltransferase Ste14
MCWGLFALVWVAGAVYNVWNAPPARIRSLGRYWWIPSVVLVWLVARELSGVSGRWVSVQWWWVHAVGLVLLVAGTVFTLWARGVLGTMWSSTAVVKDNHALRTDGPYAITRHPIYTGLLVMLLGTALVRGVGPWIVALVLAAVALEVKIHAEERLLTSAFGEEYERYRRQVPQLIPSLRRLARS